jgi:hypothetical protein
MVETRARLPAGPPATIKVRGRKHPLHLGLRRRLVVLEIVVHAGSVDGGGTGRQAGTMRRAKKAELPAEQPSMPGAKEQVTLRIDRDVLDFFQADGPGWQERINQALRKAAGK